MSTTTAGAGLEGIVVTQTRIGHVYGQQGQLIYSGYDIHDLVAHCSFEEVAHLLWYGELPNRMQLRTTKRTLAAHRHLSSQMAHIIDSMPRSAFPMAALRTAVSALGIFDPRAEENALETNISLAMEITAQVASIVAAIQRMREGKELVQPDPGISHAANFLYMLTGKHPEPLFEEVFDDCLILHMEHGLNASTFAGRVTAATLADIYSAVTSAIGALRGPLHGGANQQVMKMMIEIGEPSRARAYVEDILHQHKRVMGFGHRIYKTEDPRAAELRKWCRVLGEHVGQPQWAEIGAVIEEVMAGEKNLQCNVDFYAAPVYHMLGIPTDLFTAIFAAARTVGWTAHILEQYQHNRLIRPESEYIGPAVHAVVPINER
jgi:citrate synthase